MKMNAFKGATAWEGYIGPFWWRVPFWTYLKLGCWPEVGWDKGDLT
jgi:hypothetical protein